MIPKTLSALQTLSTQETLQKVLNNFLTKLK